MKRAILFVPLLALIFLAAAWPGESRAVPVFARKYGFNCTMCHSAFPRLNDFGSRYRENGYRLPGRENEERTVLQGPAPFAARTGAGYDSDKFKNAPEPVGDVSQFRLQGLDLLSGGLLGSKIGYFMVYPPRISESRGVVGQDGTLEMASAVFARLAGSSWLNVRAGRFEPAYAAFSVKRHLTVSPYEIYDYTFPDGIPFSETQSGVEVFGLGGKGLHYAAGVLEGAESNLSDDSPADYYARVSMVFGPGEGQTAGHRVSLIGYQGKARHLPVEAPATLRESYTRYGLDASLNFGRVNLALQYLAAKDDKGFWTGATSDPTYSGGFAEVLFQPRTDLVAFARYDRVSPPDEAPEESLSRYTAGARYYFEDQVALHAEYSSRKVSLREAGVPDATEKFFTVRLDFAF
jgi:hypothetical protein